MKKGNSEKQVMAICETVLAEKQVIDRRKHVATSHTVTIPPYITSPS